MLGVRLPAPEQCGSAPQLLRGQRAAGLMLLPALAVMKDATGPVVEFYEPGTARVPLASGKTVQLQIQGDYPRHGDVEIHVQPEAAESFTLSLRIPAWSWRTKVEVNGQEVPGVKPGSLRPTGPRLEAGRSGRHYLRLDDSRRREPGGSSQVAIVRGPIVLALDKRITQPQAGVKAATVKADSQGVVQAVEVRDGLPKGIRFAMDVPFAAADGKTVLVRMCDYASAGRTWSEESALRVWLPQPLNLEKPFAR